MNHPLKLALVITALITVGCAHDAAEGPHRQDAQSNTGNQTKQQQPLPEVEEMQEVVVTAEKKADATVNQPNRGRALISKEKAEARLSAPAAVAAQGYAHIMPHPQPYYAQEQDRENYRSREENPLRLVAEHPVSTFSIDVDTGSYTNTRRFLQNGSMPHLDSIRPEEFINYFSYQYPEADSREAPFSLYTEIAPSPWVEGKHLLHVGLRGFDVTPEQLPPSNLVFLVDVSGSMNQPNKLPLLKTALNLLTKQLSAKDKVSIVVYAGAAGVVLEPTVGNNRHAIHAALNRLRAGGSTNGEAGIQLAYSIAQQAFIKEGINRIILATDGDFNVGTSDVDALKRLVEQQRKSGISLTTLGFGMGNYNDALMNELAEIGNGNAAYIDTALEARKVLVDEVSSTLFTIAKDVKIQIEFSPQVQEYRLVGYESRMLKREDFNNDAKDAGEIGAGHTVTALYEIALAGSDAVSVDPLRYQHKKAKRPAVPHSEELAFLKLRYKLPAESKSKLIEKPIYLRDIQTESEESSANFRFSAAVAAFAQKLRGGHYTGDFSYQDIAALAKGAQGKDRFGYRNEFVRLVKMADTLQLAGNTAPVPEQTPIPVLERRPRIVH